MKSFNSIAKGLIVSASLLLSGCGFHLQGSTPIPAEMNSLYIKTQKPYDPLANNLRATLTAAGVQVASVQTDAPVTLQIINEQQTQSIGNVGTNATTRQYNLNYLVNYQITNNVGKVLAGPYAVSESAALMTTSNAMLSSNTTASDYQDQMQLQAAQQILDVLLAPDTVQKVRQGMTVTTPVKSAKNKS